MVGDRRWEIYESGLFRGNNMTSMAIAKMMVVIIVEERILGGWVILRYCIVRVDGGKQMGGKDNE